MILGKLWVGKSELLPLTVSRFSVRLGQAESRKDGDFEEGK